MRSSAQTKESFKIFTRVRGLFFVLSLFLFFIFPFAANAHYCNVSPFSKKIKQGESAEYTVSLNPSIGASSFIIKAGDPPIFVEVGFVEKVLSPDEATPPSIPLVFKTGAEAQTGSFNIIVAYAEDAGSGPQDSFCQLNLIIEETDKKPSNPSAVSPDSLLTTPAHLVKEISAGGLTFAETSIFYREIRNKDELKENLTSTSSVKEAMKKEVATTSVSSKKDGHNEDISPPAASPYFRSLQVGAHGDDVAALQTFLEERGFLQMPDGVTKGYFGLLTRQAVIKYQESVGIEPVGIVGPKTRKSLDIVSTPGISQ